MRRGFGSKTALVLVSGVLAIAGLVGSMNSRAADLIEGQRLGQGARLSHARRRARKRRVARSPRPAPRPTDPLTIDFSPERSWIGSLGPWSALLVEQERIRTLERARKTLEQRDLRRAESPAEAAGLELSHSIRARLLPQLDAELARTEEHVQALARQVAARMTAKRAAACEASVGKIRELATQLGASPNLIFHSLQTSRDDRTNELRARLDGELEDLYAAKIRRVDVSLGQKLAAERGVSAVLPGGLEAVAREQGENEKAAFRGLRADAGRLADLEKTYLNLGVVTVAEASSTGQASRLECRRALQASEVAGRRKPVDAYDFQEPTDPGEEVNPFLDSKPPVVERAI